MTIGVGGQRAELKSRTGSVLWKVTPIPLSSCSGAIETRNFSNLPCLLLYCRPVRIDQHKSNPGRLSLEPPGNKTPDFQFPGFLFPRSQSGINLEIVMPIQQHSVVSIHYKVVDNDSDQLIDSSENKEPLTYLHGASNIIAGLEQALEGRVVGDSFEVTIAPADAYGEQVADKIQTVPRNLFDNLEKVEAGVSVTADTESGPVHLVITEVTDETVTVDGNHPLAGRSLRFEVNVETIREGSDEEIAHGHVHGPEGHDH
jgi:FKBP-type peptidyl-prolyl cis-trans isomerase SlyD